jgi:UDP-N-acetylmuramyl pentapeptide phosphotransferase/UDP-N-acetylglucosamine-1-phosphate transferase
MYQNPSLIWALLLGAASAVAVWRGIPVLISAAKAKKLLDKPIEGRKAHENPTPILGGIATTYGVWLFFSLHPEAEMFSGANYFLAASIVLFLVGLKDDLYMMS